MNTYVDENGVKCFANSVEACEMINELLNSRRYLKASDCMEILLSEHLDKFLKEVDPVFDQIEEGVKDGKDEIEINTDSRREGPIITGILTPIRIVHIKSLENLGYKVEYSHWDMEKLGYVTRITVKIV